MSSFQPYPEKKVAALLDLAVTVQAKVFLWASGGSHQHLGKVLRFESAADILALSVLKDKKFHELIEKHFIDEVFVMMQVGKDQVYFKAAIRSGDEIAWNFHVASPFYKLERRRANRVAALSDMAGTAHVRFGEGTPEELAFRGPVRDLGTGGLSVLGREGELKDRVPAGTAGRVDFPFGTLAVSAGVVVVHATPIESRKMGKKLIVGLRFTGLDESVAAEIAKFVARS